MNIALAASGTQRQEKSERSDYNGQVGQVEYSRVQRTGPNHQKISDQPMTYDAIYEIAHAASQNESQAKNG
jgi:hypothetical protein